MRFSNFVAGVDRSESGAWAAATAWEWSRLAGGKCTLINAVPNDLLSDNLVPDYSGLLAEYLAGTKAALEEYLGGNVPPGALEALEAIFGRPAAVLAREAIKREADCLVVGAKHHSAVGRMLVGSTVHNVVRVAHTPVLITTPGQTGTVRILAAVDLSESAELVTDCAVDLARLHGAELRVLHVVDETMAPAGLPAATAVTELRERAHQALSERIWPIVEQAGAERSLRGGHPAELVRDELNQFGADLLVIGTHGKGWLNRAILGSVAHGLVSDPPVQLVVVPPDASVMADQPSEGASDGWSKKAGRS